jgi:hypothetical protein
MTRAAGVGRGDGLLGQPLLPQLLHAGADCLEIVSCPRP